MAGELDLSITGLRELIRASSRLLPNSQVVLQEAFVQASSDIQAVAKDHAPGRTLPDSIQVVVDKHKPPLFARVFTGHPAARFVEFGTGLFGPAKRLIRPVRASVLRWIGPEGAAVFARFTRGQKAQPFIGPATEAAPEILRRRFGDALLELGRRWARGR